MSSVSALGSSPENKWKNYKNDHHLFEEIRAHGSIFYAARIPEDVRRQINELREANRFFRKIDDAALFGLFVARMAVNDAGWKPGEAIGINVGSSRGATGLFEQYHREFLEHGRTGTLASPSTTLGNISSWIAQDLQSEGPEISHSVTCSTALHAVLNGVAWISAGMAEKFLAGGSEAALTPFTFAQMESTKIMARKSNKYPCQALNFEKKENSMVLGEGAAVICMESGRPDGAISTIKGVGYATESLQHPLSISANGSAFQKSMKMALGSLSPDDIDVVVMHAPGTVKGDLSEMEALQAIFGKNLPALTTNKWKIGHTFGASGTLSLELGVLMLQHQEFIPVPLYPEGRTPKKMQNILINAVGFGGNAVSILIGLPE